MSLLGICIVDSWLLYKGFHGGSPYVDPNSENMMLQSEFYSTLAQQLIDNSYDYTTTRGYDAGPQAAEESRAYANGDLTSGIDAHLTPTKRRKVVKGKESKFAKQNRCHVCKEGYTTFVCSECRREDPTAREVHLCHSKTSRVCFATHLRVVHDK